MQAKTCSRNYGKFKTSPSFDVVYSIAEFWGEGFFHFICENFVRLFVGLETTQSILFESNNGPKPYVEPGTTKNADRYGHTGAWYKRTSQKHADTHGLRNIH